MAAALVALMLAAPASAASLTSRLEAASGLPPSGLNLQQTTCPTPRPAVRLQTEVLGPGRLQATITAGFGSLTLIQFGVMQIAHIETPGSSQRYTSNSQIKPAAGVTSITLILVSVPAAQPEQAPPPTIVPLTVIDGCGASQPWNTFFGGGALALQPTLSIDDTAVIEGNVGNTATTFTIKLSIKASQTISVNYSTADGSARAGTDYVATSGSVTFNPGESGKTVAVQIVGNFAPEPDKTFTVTLSNPVNAPIGRAQATARIINDDDGASAGGDSYTATIGETLSVSAGAGPPPGLLVNDSAPSNDAQVASFGGLSAGGDVTSNVAGATLNLGNGGSLMVNANGAFTFTPPSNAGSAFAFRYRTTSSAGPAEATVTIEVRRRPTVTTVTPANSATTVGTSANVVVTFGEPVNVAGNWFEIACALSGSRTPTGANVAVSGGSAQPER